MFLLLRRREESVARLLQGGDALGDDVDERRREDDADGDAGEELEDDLDAAMLLLSGFLFVVLGGAEVGEADRSSGAKQAGKKNDKDGEDFEALESEFSHFCCLFVCFCSLGFFNIKYLVG